MRRDAERIVNRDTVPVTTTRFLNVPIDSPLYSPVGRVIERCMLTEIPQLVHVLSGQMSLVGNRPLPENVISALSREYPDAELRFEAPTGLTGVAQLIGRDFISDSDRLRIEIAYCQSVLTRYSFVLDIKILFFTVMLAFSRRARFTVNDVVTMLDKHTSGAASLPAKSPFSQRSGGLKAT